MSWSLLALSMTSFTLVAVLCSLAIGAALPVLDTFATKIHVRNRATLWLALSAMPAIVALIAIIAAFLPALGWGADHCYQHIGSHPHLCTHHVGSAVGLPIAAILMVVAVRSIAIVAKTIRSSIVSSRAQRVLAANSSLSDVNDVRVFVHATPQAFVLGFIHPTIFASNSLLAMDHKIVDPVMAHERAHRRQGDFAWRLLGTLLLVSHLPIVAKQLFSRLVLAQEIAADEVAAQQSLAGRTQVAEALIAMVRMQHSPINALAFTDGDIPKRVMHLLLPSQPTSQWPRMIVIASGLLVVTMLLVGNDFIHHGLETALGLLH